MFSEIAEIALVAAGLGQFLQFLKTRVILILNFTRPHATTHTNGLKEPVKVSGRNCSATGSFGLIICSFYRYVQSFTTHADAGEQI